MLLVQALLISVLVPFSTAFAKPLVTSLNHSDTRLVNGIAEAVASQVDTNSLREIRVKIVGSHAVIYMMEKNQHRVNIASYDLDREGRPTTFHGKYKLQSADRMTHAVPSCPDPNVQFIAFAPNDEPVEQQVTQEVAQAAQKAGLNTVSLLKDQATTQSYLNYMVCPNLVGNFYDGDANPDVITTADGELSSDDMQSLNGAFRQKVTNIWLACEAFNDPMLSAVLTGAKAQKYAAGVNDLDVGPSDKAGACAMEAAIQGKAMTASFQDCYKQYDDSSDQWGFQGSGSDYFGK